VRRLFAKDLRTRLTLYYSALLAVALVLYAVCVSAFYLHSLREQLDTSLDRDVETVEGELQSASNGGVELSSHEGEADGEEDEGEFQGGYLLEVLASDGAVLYRSDQLNGQALGKSPEVQARGRGEPVSLRLGSGELLRTITRLHKLSDGRLVTVRLAVNEEPYRREFWEMVGILCIGLPIVVFFVFITGRVVAARALSPVDVMAKRAAQITAEHLNERITINNPDDELGQLGTAFNATLARLESSFEQLRRFTADASHELRTPLTAIRSVGEVALSKGGNENYYRDTIGSMLEETSRLTKLVDSLLTMSRADAGQIQVQRSAVNLLDLARESAGLLEILAEEKGQTIDVQGDASLTISVDRLILRQALVNVIDNALKYSPANGRIAVRVKAVNGLAQIEVQDDGPGIAPEFTERVFQRFFRIDKARTRAEGGTGLGLSIVQWAVSANGGKVRLVSSSGSGSTFVFEFPLQLQQQG
jgi:heavy metal sensor kinase